MSLTLETVLATLPANSWMAKQVAKAWRGRGALTVDEVATLKVDVRDRLWVILAHFLDERRRRLLACDLAEQALTQAGDADPLCLEAIRVARAYANGEASADRLSEVNAAVRAASEQVPLHDSSPVRVARLCASNACSAVTALPEARPFHTGNTPGESAVMGNLHNLGIVVSWTNPYGQPGTPTMQSVREAAVKRAVAYAKGST